MIELLKKYIDENNISNALLVGQNLFNKNKGDKQIFSLYFGLLLDAAKSECSDPEKFVQQLITVLSLYSENTNLTDQEVEYIRSCENSINCVVDVIHKRTEAARAENARKIIDRNDKLLKTTNEYIVSLEKVTNRKDFESFLKKIYEIDNEFDKENFVLRQRNQYEQITNQCQTIVNNKLKQFDRLDNVEYNKRAVASYEKIFNLFKDAKNASYKPNDILELFSYDSTRLFNETLIYYNHVYNFILSKLNDEEKLTMTKLAIVAEKKG